MAPTALLDLRRSPAPFTVREADSSDNEGLVALAESCSMSGDIELRVDRRPDFFALNRLEGNWRLAVAERDGAIVGCICFSERESHVDGVAMTTGYVGDLKVHPAHRDSTIADALSMYVVEQMRYLPPETRVLITVLAGNRAMERRLDGRRGLPRFMRAATVRTHSMPILWRRCRDGPGHAAITIRRAAWNDIEEMAILWKSVASGRQLSPAYDADSLAQWIREAPGLEISDYRLARDTNGNILGFIGLWDQREFKQLGVVSYSRRMATARRVFNAVAPLLGAERLPLSGAALNLVTAVNVCVPSDRADVLNALVVKSHDELRHAGYSLLNIGLDRRDPLNAGIAGLFAQPTDINAYLTNGRGRELERPLQGLLHYEIALV